MHRLTTTYRSLIAYFLSAWTVAIIISGVVFMHKEVTSTSEIITHVHPYDFTKKGEPHHHDSDAEIQYLNVVFAGAFLAPDLQVFEMAITPITLLVDYAELAETVLSQEIRHYNLRGPPQFG
ncbi:hypothetical protein [Sphingobacterium deserti]|uniref:Uncharacterized protein n=1 Tax=Sphingobacterium deserti TaxID=1229276 RepID=A0A0B8TAQ5_9SPHI|nr:hypothetical protein [Sphingobacterium deserti]KGE15180.1 hypothetical protein DI53_1045 [Sphingobacterium deserti]